MDKFLRNYQWALHFVVLGLGATLTATIVNRAVVSAQLAPLTVPKLPSHQLSDGGDESKTSSTPDASRWDDALASRCLFGCASKDEEKDKKCPGGCGKGKECKDGVCVPTEKQKAKPKQPDVPVESDLNVKLLGCMVAGNPKYSFAMVQDGKSQETYVVSPGDYLPEDSKVVRIARDRVFIRRDGQLEFVRLEETIGGDPSPVSVSPSGAGGGSAPTTGAAARAVRDFQGGGSGKGLIRNSSEDQMVLSEKNVQKKLEDKRELAREVQTTANYENGEKKGVKLVGVSPNSLYSQLGFETGDVLHSVGGEKINSATDIQSLIDRLETKDSISVVVERDGKKIKREFKLE